MESPMAIFPLVGALDVAEIAARRDLFQPMQSCDGASLPLDIACLDRSPQSFAFEFAAPFRDICKLRLAERGNAEAALAVRLHQSLADQLKQSFANGARAYAITVFEVVCLDFSAGWEKARHDIGPQQVEHPFGHSLMGQTVAGERACVCGKKDRLFCVVH